MAARLSLALLIALFAALGAGTAAQQYQVLHVQSFTLSSDTSTPQIEQPFHVTLSIKVREKVPQLQNVYLPSFSGAEEIGDERESLQDSTGTLYRETLTLVAHARGPITIGSAYLDAIDGRDGKPKRFISNSLALNAGGGVLRDVWGPIRAMLLFALELVLLVVALFVIVTLFRRPRRVPAVVAPVPPTAPPQVPAAPQSADEPLRASLDDLRVQRNRPCVLGVRHALWTLVGAPDGATLADVLHAGVSGDGRFRGLLVAVERASFIDETRLDEAIAQVLAESERSL